MDKTLDCLTGEGNIETVTTIKKRISCDNCGKPAHYKFSWLLNGTRSNPASSAYGKDDCSWCEDSCTYSCRGCRDKIKPPEGYVECSIFPATEKFAHMFLRKEIMTDV